MESFMVHVVVTEDDIRNGEITCGKCPIALAVTRGIPDVDSVNVLTCILVKLDGWWYRASLPGVAARFIRYFDRQSPVKPIAFSVKFTREVAAA